MKEDILNELSNIRHTEIKEREPLGKIQDNKKNKRMTNLGNYTSESVNIFLTYFFFPFSSIEYIL